MSTRAIIFTVIAAIIIAVGAIYFVEVEQTQEAKLPDVDVEVEGGQAPEFEVETGSVKVGETETEVTVPKVTLEEETVTVPTIEVEPAGEPETDAAESETGSNEDNSQASTGENTTTNSN